MAVKTRSWGWTCFMAVAFLFWAGGIGRAAEYYYDDDNNFCQVQGRLRLGLTYANGAHQLSDAMSDFYEGQGSDVSRFTVPVGITLSGGPEWDFGNAIGAPGIDFRLGPPIVVGTRDGARRNDGVVPLGAGVRYTLLPDMPASPYVRAGFAYLAPFGNFIDEKRVGFDGAFGVEFLRNKPVGLGVEFGWDTAEVEAFGQTVKPIGFNVGVYVSFRL